MAAINSLYAKSVQFSSTTWNSTDGNPIGVSIAPSCAPVYFTGADNATYVSLGLPGKHWKISVSLGQVYDASSLMFTTATLIVVVSTDGGSTLSKTIANATLIDSAIEQEHGQAGTLRLEFVAPWA